jgi:hypothetical protein
MRKHPFHRSNQESRGLAGSDLKNKNKCQIGKIREKQLGSTNLQYLNIFPKNARNNKNSNERKSKQRRMGIPRPGGDFVAHGKNVYFGFIYEV